MANVTLLTPADDGAWDAFLAARPEATLYHSSRYRDLLEALTGARLEYLVAKRAGAVVGVLPTMSLPGPFGTVINSLPFFGSHGGVIAADDDAEAALSAEFAERVSASDVAAATVVENPFSARASLPAGSMLEDTRISQITPLQPRDEGGTALLDRFDGSARRNIRKAERSGVTVTVENDAIAFVAETHYANMAKMGGIAKPRVFFEAFPRLFRADHDYRIYVARHERRPVAALLLFYYKGFAEYFTPVTQVDDRELQPMAAILYRAMTDAAQRGCSVWNWGGTWTTQTGVYRFKRKWGAEEREYRYATTVKSESLLQHTPESLRSAYPWFFVVPFRILTETDMS